MNIGVAQQIATLINTQNHLARTLSVDEVMRRSGSFIYFGLVAPVPEIWGVLQVRYLTFYLSEIRYVSVHPEHRRAGLATRLINHAERLSTRPFINMTTRLDNEPMLHCLNKAGYTPQGTPFQNPATGHMCVLWQKGLQNELQDRCVPTQQRP